VYEIVFIVLALFVVTITIMDLSGYIDLESNIALSTLDFAILVLFIVEYAVRFFIYKGKKSKFIKENIIDLIAIIPFSSLFRVFRIFRLLRVLKATKFLKVVKILKAGAFISKTLKGFSALLKTNGFIYIIYISLATLLTGSTAIYLFEYREAGKSFMDALWWSVVTVTTVGYGDISPATTIGRIIAIILMITGIGFIGVMTSTLATYFISKKSEEKNIIINKNNYKLSDEEIKTVETFIKFIANKKADSIGKEESDK
jgi:voltage-gated potassium channel